MTQDPLTEAVERERKKFGWPHIAVMVVGGAIQFFSANALYVAFRPASAEGSLFESMADQKSTLLALGVAGYVVGTVIAAYALSRFGERSALTQLPKAVLLGGVFFPLAAMIVGRPIRTDQSTYRRPRPPAPPGVAELALDRGLAKALLGGELGAIECRYSRALGASICSCAGGGKTNLTLSVGQVTPKKLAKYRAREQKDGQRYIDGDAVRAGPGWTLISEDWEVNTRLVGAEPTAAQLDQLEQLGAHAMAAVKNIEPR